MVVPQASDGLGDPRLLETIDKLVELNIGDSVALPQLLVVGDQSSGKSSVLEGLTGLPFPRDSALCTRFATQITFRRAPTSNIIVSIIPDKNASNEDAARMKAWKKDGLTSLDRANFSGILEEVHKIMGIGDLSTGAKKSFSDDVLRIEVAGPTEQHLSVVDVPGIFRKITEGVTTQLDIANVRAMAERYMDNMRSVILAVIPANVDIATQEILEMAKVYDKEGQRTLGVLTKPDLVDKGAEDNVVNLVRGTSHKMKLGWCIVKNPGQQDLKRGADFDRHIAEEAFFKNEAIWSKLDRTRVGVASLRLRLIDLLTEIVRKEFNNVRADVIRNLKASEKKLKALGPCRETKDQQQKYLLDLATQFQVITTQALEANYGYDDIFDSKPALRIATAVVNRHDVFSDDVWHKGLTMEFKRQTAQKRVAESAESNSFALFATPSSKSTQPIQKRGKTTTSGFGTSSQSPSVPPLSPIPPLSTPFEPPEVESKMLDTRYHFTSGDLEEMLHNDQVASSTDKGIMEWIEKEYKGSRGFEIGTFGASLLHGMWKKQSVKWERLALGYISDCVAMVHNYICGLLEAICEDSRARSGLLSVLMDKLNERYRCAIDQTHFVFQVERNVLTTNHYFTDNLEKCKFHHTIDMVKDKTIDDVEHGYVVKLSDLHRATNMSNNESTIQLLHDILESYYKVARKRFVDNICMQAADYHLVRGPDTPVKVLSPSFVSGLTPEQLDRIAGEDALTRRTRAELTRQVESLKKAKKLLVMV
ncbi:MAG: hypothetical protein Q9213_000105 [Squamulea squamosa]